jgi:hypothetical protein
MVRAFVFWAGARVEQFLGKIRITASILEGFKPQGLARHGG